MDLEAHPNGVNVTGVGLDSLPVNGIVGAERSAIQYLARQPILDVHGKVHGYELLFRAGRESMASSNRNVRSSA